MLVVDNRDHGDQIEVVLAGELDIESAPALRNVLTGTMAQTEKPVVLSLEHLTFLDCVGVGILVAAARRAAEESREFAVRDPAPLPAMVLAQTRADRVLRVLPA